jgi:hypothetical protein
VSRPAQALHGLDQPHLTLDGRRRRELDEHRRAREAPPRRVPRLELLLDVEHAAGLETPPDHVAHRGVSQAVCPSRLGSGDERR